MPKYKKKKKRYSVNNTFILNNGHFQLTYASIAGMAYSPVLVNMAPLAPGSTFTMKLCGMPLLILTGLGPSEFLSCN